MSSNSQAKQCFIWISRHAQLFVDHRWEWLRSDKALDGRAHLTKQVGVVCSALLLNVTVTCCTGVDSSVATSLPI